MSGLSVCRSVCHSIEPAKTADAIEMPFGLRTFVLVGPRNHVLLGVHIPMGRGNFKMGKGRPVVKYRD